MGTKKTSKTKKEKNTLKNIKIWTVENWECEQFSLSPTPTEPSAELKRKLEKNIIKNYLILVDFLWFSILYFSVLTILIVLILF